VLSAAAFTDAERRVRRKLHQTIRKIGEDIEELRFNTAVAALMELVNELYARWPVDSPLSKRGEEGSVSPAEATLSEALENLVLLTAPFAPHLADELWERMGKQGSTYHAAWPAFDAAAAAEEEITLVVQVNGKVRDRLTVPAETSDEVLKQMALASQKVAEMLNGKQVRNVIVVPKKLVNIVIG
ncbi:MAG TPA: class I tRNA ligase family protein, partial [Chthonomonadales bacterium]|nr:class I tRNA ligase family protein [Chthonomonadales bacterium]